MVTLQDFIWLDKFFFNISYEHFYRCSISLGDIRDENLGFCLLCEYQPTQKIFDNKIITYCGQQYEFQTGTNLDIKVKFEQVGYVFLNEFSVTCYKPTGQLSN